MTVRRDGRETGPRAENRSSGQACLWGAFLSTASGQGGPDGGLAGEWAAMTSVPAPHTSPGRVPPLTVPPRDPVWQEAGCRDICVIATRFAVSGGVGGLFSEMRL